MLVFLYGRDAYRLKQNLAKVTGEYLAKNPNGMGVLAVDLTEGKEELEKLENAIKTVGFFKEKKLIVARNAFTEAEKVLGLIKEWKLSEDKEIILMVAQAGNQTELNKQSKKLFTLMTASRPPAGGVAKSFEPLTGKQLENWLAKEAEGLEVNIKPPVLSRLVEWVGKDSWRLRLELEKLASYSKAKGEKEIALTAVELLVTKPLEQNIFAAIDALGNRQRGQAITLLARELEAGADPFRVFSMFVYQFRNLLSVKDNNGKAPAGMHPYVFKKISEQASRFTLAELKQKFTRLAEADLLIKSGQIDIVDFLFQTATI